MKKLKKPPIQEAIIDIRCKLAKDFDFSVFKNDLKLLPSNMQNFEENLEVSLPMQTDFGLANRNRGYIKKLNGIFLQTDDKKEIAQFRDTGFTFNRLHPYIGWEELLRSCKAAFNPFYSIAKPEVITRLAVRYINNIPLENNSDFNLDSFPFLPKGDVHSDLSIGKLYQSMLILDKVSRVKCILKHSLLVDDKSKKPKIQVDIDAFLDEMEIKDPRCIWPEFEKLRKYKNKIFEKSLTTSKMSEFD